MPFHIWKGTEDCRGAGWSLRAAAEGATLKALLCARRPLGDLDFRAALWNAIPMCEGRSLLRSSPVVSSSLLACPSSLPLPAHLISSCLRVCLPLSDHWVTWTSRSPAALWSATPTCDACRCSPTTATWCWAGVKVWVGQVKPKAPRGCLLRGAELFIHGVQR